MSHVDSLGKCPAMAVPGGVGTHACYQSFKCTPFLGYFYEEHPLFSANLGENHSKKYPLISKIWEVYLMGCYTVCALMFVGMFFRVRVPGESRNGHCSQRVI